MIRLLLAPGSVAAANGITADVDILLDAGAAGSAGDDFTINLTLDEGAATGEGFSAGLDESVALSIAGGEVAAGVEIAGADETVTVTFSSGQAPGGGLNADVGVSLVAGEAEGNSFDADAAAYIAAVEAADAQTLEPDVKTAYNDFVVGCKADGIWNAIKASCILAGARTLTGALTPLVGTAPTNFNFVSGDYNRKTGLVGDGSTKYLNSNRNNNADPQNSQHMACYQTSLSTAGSNSRLMSGRNPETGTGSSQITCVDSDNINEFFSRFDGTIWNVLPRPAAPKFLGITRASGTGYVYRQAGTSATRNDSSAAAASQNIFIFTDPRLTSMFYTNARLAFYSIGESLDLALLDTRVSTLISAIDAAIP
jgi:hypothetical protein